jgi:hypothetical protein
MVDFPNLDSVHLQTATLPAQIGEHHQQGQIAHSPQRNLMRTIGTFTGGGFFFIFILILADLVLMPSLKPSQVWGTFMGNVARAQTEASGPSAVKLEQQLAQVRSQEQAKAQAAAQEQVARVQNQLDTTKEAYGSLYRRSEALVGSFLQVQATAQQYRSQAAAAGNMGASYVNMGTSFMCAISRANDDGDKDGWCASNDRVREGQAQDLNSVVVTKEQLEQQLYGGLPDPPVQRVRDAQAAAIAPPAQ